MCSTCTAADPISEYACFDFKTEHAPDPSSSSKRLSSLFIEWQHHALGGAMHWRCIACGRSTGQARWHRSSGGPLHCTHSSEGKHHFGHLGQVGADETQNSKQRLVNFSQNTCAKLSRKRNRGSRDRLGCRGARPIGVGGVGGCARVAGGLCGGVWLAGRH